MLHLEESDGAFEMIYNDDGSLLARELWTNMDVVRAWFDAGGDFFPNEFTQSMANNEEFGLLLAERFAKKFEECGFDPEVFEVLSSEFRDAISVDLRRNKDFMMKACEVRLKTLRHLLPVESFSHFSLSRL